jgi:putative ABC transport system permease protein
MDVVFQELRFALRALRRRPGFSLVATLTLALGIGAATAIFSVVDAVLLRPLPYPDPDGLQFVATYDMPEGPEAGQGNMSQADIESVRGLASFAAAEGYSDGSIPVTGRGDPVLVEGARVTGGLMTALGVTPHLGRDLRHEENAPDAPRVVVVGYDFWRSQLGGQPDVIGATLEIAEVVHEIVGVAAPGFSFPDRTQLWTPRRLDEGCGRGCHTYDAVARLVPGVSRERANQELHALARGLSDQFPDSNHEKGLYARPLVDHLVGDVRRGLWTLLGAVGIVLLIACANVANLLLVRGSTRSSEIAVRSALGAGPRRMLGTVLTESAVLAALGAVFGVALAQVSVYGLRLVPPGTIPRIDDVTLDGRVLIFALGLTILVTLLFGMAPALRLARTAPASDLGGAARAGREPGDARSRSLLLAGEVALSVMLLAGAGLFIRSLTELHAVDLGFEEREIARFRLNLPISRYDELGPITDYFERLEEGLRAIPGVEAVGSVFSPPLGFGNIIADVYVEGRPAPDPGQETSAALHPATPGYLETMGIPVLRGRGIERTDRIDTEAVALVNETFVRENFPDEEVLGRHVGVTASFGHERDTLWTVVGVVADSRRNLESEPRAQVYVPHAQFGAGDLTVHLRGRANAGGLLPAARETVRALDPNVPMARAETLTEAIRRETGATRFYLGVVGLFAALAVVLAAIGLYGVVSYLVSRRTREIGIRVALGAGTGRVRRMVLLQGLRPALAGVAAGVVGALLAGRVVASLLYEVRPRDPVVLAAVVAVLLLVSLIATLVPAIRATRVDPVDALGAE